MSPYFVGRGTWNKWEGIGVVSGGGEGADLIASIMDLVEKLDGMEAFLIHATRYDSGWRNLLNNEPLEESSGVYPFKVDQDEFQREFLGNERAVFLHSANRPNILEVWKNSTLIGKISDTGTLEYRPEQD